MEEKSNHFPAEMPLNHQQADGREALRDMLSSSRHVILIDFGSTYTKLAVLDLKENSLIHTANYPSTVATDACIGLERCFKTARQTIGERSFKASLKLSSSSAAGGLRMGVIGLSKSLSIAVGRNAAFGAGAKVLKTCAGPLKEEDLEELSTPNLEILLFCGGYENGNTSTLEHNAEMLAKSHIHIPIIYAGNSRVAPSVRRLFSTAKKEFYVAPNIIPGVGVLNKEELEKLIRDIFLKRIINMKKLNLVASKLDKMLMPTPAAVLGAGELLSSGTAGQVGLGPLMIVDVGGATTDIHSYADQIPYDGLKIIGAQDDFKKRTVEADLGVRESSNSLSVEIGHEKIMEETGLSQPELEKTLNLYLAEPDRVPETKEERKLDFALSAGAVRIASRRHAGRIVRVSSAGIKEAQQGKNLSMVENIIGTGGPLIYSSNPLGVLSQVLRDARREKDVLLPEKAKYFLDGEYIFFAAGLLRELSEESALKLMLNSLKEI